MLTAKHKLEFKTGKRSAKTIVEAGTQPDQPTLGRLPRITKMMALAIRLDHLIKSGQVKDQAELARVGHVSRARLTQIMNLLHLAPDIQEELLFLPRHHCNNDALRVRELYPIALTLEWSMQRRLWRSKHRSLVNNLASSFTRQRSSES